MNVDILALGIGFRIVGKSNYALVIAVNDQYTQGKICILEPNKKAEVRSNQTIFVRRYCYKICAR